jgi:hypothetical protein
MVSIISISYNIYRLIRSFFASHRTELTSYDTSSVLASREIHSEFVESLTEEPEFSQVHLCNIINEEITLPIASPVSYTVFETQIFPDLIGIIHSSTEPRSNDSTYGQVFPSFDENQDRNMETNRCNYFIKCFKKYSKNFVCIYCTLVCIFFIYIMLT